VLKKTISLLNQTHSVCVYVQNGRGDSYQESYITEVDGEVSIGLKVVMGLGQNFLTQVGSGQLFVAWVGSAIYGLGLDCENFSQKCQNFQFISLSGQKKNLFRLGPKVPRLKVVWPLIYCGSKVCSGQVRAHL